MAKANTQIEVEYEMTLRITVKGYGNKEASLKTAGNIKRILEVQLQKSVDVELHNGRKYEPVKRVDRNATDVDGGDAALL